MIFQNKLNLSRNNDYSVIEYNPNNNKLTIRRTNVNINEYMNKKTLTFNAYKKKGLWVGLDWEDKYFRWSYENKKPCKTVHYIWHKSVASVNPDPEHASWDNKIFRADTGILPGERYGCNCYGEELSEFHERYPHNSYSGYFRGYENEQKRIDDKN